MLLVEVGSPLQKLCALLSTEGVPGNLCGMPGANHPVHVIDGRLERGSDGYPVVMGRYDRPRLTLSEARLRRPGPGFERFQACEQRLAHQWVAKVDSGAVATLGTEEVCRQDDLGVALGCKRLQLRDRVPHQLVERDLLVSDAVHEARIRAILEQAPDEIGEQLLVTPDGCINAHRRTPVAEMPLETGKLLVELLAHAVQSLEFELTRSGERLHLPDRVRVVGCERGVNHVACVEQLLRAG